MKAPRRNIRIIAERAGEEQMDIYMDISGQKEYLMRHRYNYKLFSLLKDGIHIEQLRRSTEHYKLRGYKRNPSQRRLSQALENSMTHLMTVADEYIRYELGSIESAAA